MNNIVISIGIKVIGGRTLSTTAVLQNNYFASGPSLPYNIAEAASIEVNDNIYVIGGKGKEFSNGTQKLLCGNVTNFSIAKNGCAHRVQRTGISLGLVF